MIDLLSLSIPSKRSCQSIFCDLSDSSISFVMWVVPDGELGQSDEGEGDEEEGEERGESCDAWLVHYVVGIFGYQKKHERKRSER